jgi:hypothetical protein
MVPNLKVQMPLDEDLLFLFWFIQDAFKIFEHIKAKFSWCQLQE